MDFSEMTSEHLGTAATEADLDAFQIACARRMTSHDLTAAEATDWAWNDGNIVPEALLDT